MNQAAFKSLLDGFAATRASLDWWLGFWTWFVIIGVAFELIFTVWSHWEDHSEWKDGWIHARIPFPSKPKRLKLIFEMLSIALVVVGITGELHIDAGLGRLESNVQAAYANQLDFVTQEAGDASQSALIAAGAAGRANEHAGDAENRAAHAGKQAVKVDQALNMVQGFSAARQIPDRSALQKQLEARFKGKRVVLRSYRNDGEAYFLCGELALVFHKAELATTDQCGEEPFPDQDFPSTGIYVSGPDDRSILDLMKILGPSSIPLGTAGGPFGPHAQRPSYLFVFVGRKTDVHVGETAQTRDAERRVAAMKKQRNAKKR